MSTDFISSGGFSLAELLNDKTIPQIKDMALTIGIRFPGSPKKAQLVYSLAEIMKEKPELLIESLFCYELKAYMDAIDGKMTIEYAERSGLLFELNRFGLLYAVDFKSQNTSHLFFCKEIGDIIRPLIPAELERREKDGSYMAEKLALGCANFYGYMSMAFLEKNYFETLCKRANIPYTDEALTKTFYPLLGAIHCIAPGKEQAFLSPFAAYNGFKLNAHFVDWDLEPAKADFDTLLEYGEMPYPIIKCKGADKLRKMLAKYGNTNAGSPDEVIRELWIDKQDETLNLRIPAIDKYFLLHDIDTVNECVRAVMDFLNSVPYWKLHGHSSEEIAAKRSAAKPNIVVGPNLRAMGIESVDQIDEMARRDEGLPLPNVHAPNNKIGRNDPCPCGSGKKYKHCCGK